MGMFERTLTRMPGQTYGQKRSVMLILLAAFGVMIVISVVLWVSSPATRLVGEVMFAVACLGELGVYFLGRVRKRISSSDAAVIEKYGLK